MITEYNGRQRLQPSRAPVIFCHLIVTHTKQGEQSEHEDSRGDSPVRRLAGVLTGSLFTLDVAGDGR